MSSPKVQRTAGPRGPGATPGAAPHPWSWLAALPSILIVLTVYVWFVSLGTWTRWPGYSNYHDQLASAFARGQLNLEAKPDAALLALEDPYDPAARKDIPILSDASLYDGKYYLYFGPVPALILAASKNIVRVTVDDQLLVFLFTCGVFLMLCLSALDLWRRLAPRTPGWMVAFSVLVLGLINPSTWILGSRAAVHDSAISAGQFFFLAGLYAAFRALDRTRGAARWAALAGVFWAASFGSRITQVLPIGLVALLWVLTKLNSKGPAAVPSGLAESMLGMAIPLALGAMALGWYNWARFGSVFETGISYQLALLPLQKYRQSIFSISYVLQNTYNYLLMPPKVRYNFPYVWPQMGVRTPILPSVSLSPLYFAEDITGLVFTAPFLLMALAPCVRGGARTTAGLTDEAGRSQVNWLLTALWGSFLVGFGFFLVFFWASERYLLDFLPSASLLSVLGFWQLSERLRPRAIARPIAIGLGVGLGALSALGSALLAIALNAEALRTLNPVLWMRLNNLFRP